MTMQERFKYQFRLRAIFRPGAPIDTQSLFSGRQRQVEAVLNGTFQTGQHIVMFGERGVGKTSLAKTLADILKNAGVTPLSSGTVNCDELTIFRASGTRYFENFRSSLRQIRLDSHPNRKSALLIWMLCCRSE